MPDRPYGDVARNQAKVGFNSRRSDSGVRGAEQEVRLHGDGAQNQAEAEFTSAGATGVRGAKQAVRTAIAAPRLKEVVAVQGLEPRTLRI